MDQLSKIIAQFSLQAGVFYTGKLCGLSHFNQTALVDGHIHLLKTGCLTVTGIADKPVVLDKPSIVFVPRPQKHTLKATELDRAEVICANVQYGAGTSNSLANALPSVLVLPIEQSPFLQTNIEWMLDEAGKEEEGRQAILNRLMEIFIINMLRSIINNRQLRSGMLAGLIHPQLKNVLNAIHNAPEQNWPLEKMAELAAMSRSKFADEFKKVIGQTPNDYLVEWRLSTAQSMLLQGKSVGLVANAVGYDTASALSRIFRKKTGKAPKEWLLCSQSNH